MPRAGRRSIGRESNDGNPFFLADVFTDTPLAGNPLAVVADCEFLDDATMKRIARGDGGR
jgi:predicted PhzF superfamily epimerase YddE/YHI9